MKTLLPVIILLVTFQLSAQENIEVRASKMAINSTMQPAFVVEIPQADSKEAIKMWEDRLVPKNLFDTFKKLPKMEKEDRDKWYISGVVIDEICPDTLNVFTRINSEKGGITFVTLFQADKGFIGSDNGNDELNQRTKSYVRNIAVDIYKQAVEGELDELKKDLKKMENEYSGYGKDNKKLDRKSSESRSSLDLMNIGTGISVSEEKQKEIKKEEKALKKYEKKIDKNTGKQEKLEKEIKKKELEIKEVEEKLKNIK